MFECPSEVGKVNTEGHVKMFVKLDGTYDNCTVSNLHLFVSRLSNIFNVSSGTGLQLRCIKPGCLKLTFKLSFYVIEDIFPLSSEQEAALAGLGVGQNLVHLSIQQTTTSGNTELAIYYEKMILWLSMSQEGKKEDTERRELLS